MTDPIEAPISVAIVDGDDVVAEMLSFCITNESDLQLVGVASTVADAVSLVKQENPRVVLLDYRLSDGDGIEAFKQVLEFSPDVKVVMLKGIGEHDLLVRAIEGGCVGLLSKDRPESDVLAAVRSAARGGLVMRTGQFTDMLRWLRSTPNQNSKWLSPREQAVLELLAKEHSEEGVAAELMIPVSSVQNHIRDTLMKLGAQSKLEAVAFAVRDKLIIFQDA